MEPDELPQGLLTALAAAPHVCVLSGAGMSAESGVPTFRDAATGLWAGVRPEDLASPEGFRRDPARVWAWYEWRRRLLVSVEPNPAHHALVALEAHMPRLTVVTQNVDGLHQRAGSRIVLELHGSLSRDRCFRDDQPIRRAEALPGTPPRCPDCGAAVRPDVVWFGEALPEGVLQGAVRAATGCQVFMAVGTAAVVQPAAGLADAARQAGATVVEINPEATPLTPRADYVIPRPAGEALPALVAALDRRSA